MNNARQRFVMAIWEGGGNVPPQLGVARRLIAEGHHVHVVADPTIRSAAESLGCTFAPWRRAPHRTSLDPGEDILKDWETNNPLVMLTRVRDRFLAGPAADFAADTADEIASCRPDALVADSLLFGSVIAGQAARIPVALLVPNIWMFPTRGTPSIGPGWPPARGVLGRGRDAAMLAITNRLFKKGLPELNAARAEHGLEPLTSFYDQALGVDRIIVLSSAEFDFAAPFVPHNVRYVGPILDEPGWADPWTDPWADRPGDDPLVLVALSSTFQNQRPLIERIVEALASLPVRAVVTMGQTLAGGEVPSTDNVRVVGSAPHAPILEGAALAVTHCGHGTTMKALAAGVPMVCLPMGRDQNDTAARVAYHRAGVRLSPKASVEAIRAAVVGVLAGEAYRRNAARLSAAIKAGCDTTTLIAELEHLRNPTAPGATNGVRPRM
jgi:MGT family glycosyltransferase